MGDTLVIGLDPGVTRFGAIAVDPSLPDPVAFATFASPGKEYSGRPHYQRVVQLAGQVAAFVRAASKGYKTLVISIEKPVYTKNVLGFELQWRLFQQVLNSIHHHCNPDIVVEVNPTSAKKSATGDGRAKKHDMVEASSFCYSADGGPFSDEDTEALADAEAIAGCYFNSRLSSEYNPNDKTPAVRQGPCVSWGVS